MKGARQCSSKSEKEVYVRQEIVKVHKMQAHAKRPDKRSKLVSGQTSEEQIYE